ncbi:MAG: peptide chain release factor-like protein [Planctomycetota bacterium]
MPASFAQSDSELLAECRLEHFRGPGPGGQKRNKTSNAVRLTHLPTSVSVTAVETRSQKQNLAAALKRLRRRLVLEQRRRPTDPSAFIRHGRWSATSLEALAVLLDHLADAQWSVSDTAARLGVSTASIAKAVTRDGETLTVVNRERERCGWKPLSP